MNRLQRPEPQLTNVRWSVARQRPMQHAYLVLHGGQHVGWVAPVKGGWRWITTWSPIDGWSRPRQSLHSYATWQHALAALARTDVALTVTGELDVPPVDGWERHYLVRGKTWMPKPERAEVSS